MIQSGRLLRSTRLGIASSFVIYSLLVILLFRSFQFVIGPDAISYFSIARRYANGQWAEAVNTNWGPLYCWLLAPLIAAGWTDAAAGRLVCWLSGALVLYALLRWARHLELRPLMEVLVMMVGAVMVASYALIRIGPDLLLAALLLLYFLVAVDRRYPRSRWSGPLCGVFGALLFLTKSYGFFFFVAHFTLTTLWFSFSRKPGARRAVLGNFVAGLAAFAVMAAPWIVAMSWKTGAVTTGSTAAFNYRLVGPAGGYPQYGRLIPPPEEHAVSMWEQPDPALLPNWLPSRSRAALTHQLRLLFANTRDVFEISLEASALSFAIVLAYVVMGLSGRARGECEWWLAIVSLLIYPAGYLPVLVQDRYLWGWLLLILILGASVVQTILDGGALPAAGQWVLLAVFAGSFLQLPPRQLVAQRNGGRAVFDLSERIRERDPLRGNVASCAHWNDSLTLAYYLNLRFYGTTGWDAEEAEIDRHLLAKPVAARPGASADGEAGRQLIEHGVNYYFAWTNCEATPSYVLAHDEITHGGLPGLRIYRLTDAP